MVQCKIKQKLYEKKKRYLLAWSKNFLSNTKLLWIKVSSSNVKDILLIKLMKKLFRLAVNTIYLVLFRHKHLSFKIYYNDNFVTVKPTRDCFLFNNMMNQQKEKKDGCVKTFSNFIFLQPFNEKSLPYLLYNKQRMCVCFVCVCSF